LAVMELAIFVLFLSPGALCEIQSQKPRVDRVGYTGGTRGARYLSIVDPKDDDSVSLPAASSKSSSTTDSSSSSMTRGVSPAAAKTLDASSSGGSTSDSSKPSQSSSLSSSTSTASTSSPPKSAAGKPQSTNSTAASKPVPGNNTTSAKPSTASKPAPKPTGNSTVAGAKTANTKSSNSSASTSSTSTKQNVTDPGEHHSSFHKPLPPSYNYQDDDNFPATELDSPLNPVVDDISQLLDDDQYYNATRSVLPPEQEPPTHWPVAVFGIFLGAAVVLFAATAFKSYQKRKTYTAVPSS